jgi:hypothetical protein
VDELDTASFIKTTSILPFWRFFMFARLRRRGESTILPNGCLAGEAIGTKVVIFINVFEVWNLVELTVSCLNGGLFEKN